MDADNSTLSPSGALLDDRLRNFLHDANVDDDGSMQQLLRRLSSFGAGTSTSHGGSEAHSVDEILAEAPDWDAFDVFALATAAPGRVLQLVTWDLLQRLGVVAALGLDATRLQAFLRRVEAMYEHPNSYHNAIHAADVVQSLGCFLLDDGMAQRLSPAEQLALVLAAACHDVGHPGVGNGFHTAAVTPAFQSYGGVSTNEELHIDLTLQLLDDPEMRCLEPLGGDAADQIKRLIRSVILVTDMARQEEARKAFNVALAAHGPVLDAWPSESRTLALGQLLHAADIGNCSKPWRLSSLWSFRVMQEFWAQGDKSKALGLTCAPRALFDRDSSSIPGCQGSFAGGSARSLMRDLASLLPVCAARCEANLRANVATWESLITYETQRSELVRRQSVLVNWAVDAAVNAVPGPLMQPPPAAPDAAGPAAAKN